MLPKSRVYHSVHLPCKWCPVSCSVSVALTLRSLSLSPTRPRPVILTVPPAFPGLPAVSWILIREHSLYSAPLLRIFCAYSFLLSSATLPCLWGFSLLFSECLDYREGSSSTSQSHQLTGRNETALPMWLASWITVGSKSAAWLHLLALLPASCVSFGTSVSRCLAMAHCPVCKRMRITPVLWGDEN